MKRLRLLLLLVLSTTYAFAELPQQPTSGGGLREQAMEATRKLAAQISLDDARVVQVRRFMYERLQQESQIASTYSNDPAMRQNKLHVIEQEFAEKLKGVLTETQLSRYQSFVAQTTTLAPTATAVLAPVQPQPAAQSSAADTTQSKPAPEQ